MSHTVVLEISCKEGMGPAVLEGLLVSLVDTRAYEGAELIEAYVDADNPDLLFIWEKWATRGNQEAYMAWRMETGALDGLADVITGPPRFLHLSPAE